MMMGSTSRTNPRAYTLPHLLDLYAAYVADMRGSKKAIHPVHFSPVPVAFVFQQPSELTPSDILNMFGELVIFEHPRHIQVFQPDQAVLVYQMAACFV